MQLEHADVAGVMPPDIIVSQLLARVAIPSRMQPPTEAALRHAGFVFRVHPDDPSPLTYAVYPDGWTFVESGLTQSRLVLKLIDDKGRCRAYARVSHTSSLADIDARRRFSYRQLCCDETGVTAHPKGELCKHRAVYLTDAGVAFYKVGIVGEYIGGINTLQRKADQYLRENLPEYKDLNAYWDKP